MGIRRLCLPIAAELADGSAPSPDELRSAKVIFDRLVPAYLAAQKPAAAHAQSNSKTVQVTLVRWPYS